MGESCGIKVAFIAIVIAAFITLDLPLALFVINWYRKISIMMFAFLVFFNFSFSLIFSKGFYPSSSNRINYPNLND